ncbi:tyrosine-type recombinase/integrase [Nocardia gipuzkoensis]|uniref:tyrosine-type recombinase/integrase n=1 Tax=Nocardia gipuzkoensis TaxID=2749991 RepID=UPI00237E5F0D|nr:tyrosine-type recombinase/integrase [Nocardia gipuzkoensis]MDE1675101.1 tyrosine-type recombinase/integrase [Nocardia gipuzkoensis]
MTAISATLQNFFTERLVKHRHVSPRTVASYRDSLKLLLGFVSQRTKKPPADLDWSDLDVEAITAFLDYLEHERNNSPRTRNLRLTAIRSLFTYASLRHPEHAELIQRVLAIPPKRFDKQLVAFLNRTEIDAMLAAPNRDRWEGRRDHALLLVAVQTGLRVAELIGLNCGDITLGAGANLRCLGKGRKHRAVPLTTPTQRVLRVWIAERGGDADQPLFPTRTGRRLSADAVERLVRRHATTAARSCRSIRPAELHPHVLRHSCAMALLHAGVDTAVIALWLGHADIRSTGIYLHADMTIKQRALDQTTPTSTPPGIYRPTDSLLAFLESL